MSSRREELLDAALSYLLEHGVANVSLRPMAQALGTSARMLLFYFKSKEGLIQAVMEELQARAKASFIQTCGHRTEGETRPLFRRFWDWATSDADSRMLKLLYEAHVVASQNPAEYGRYLKTVSVDLQAIVLEALPEPVRTPAMATLCIAVFDGLFLEFMITGDRERTGAALDHFIAAAMAR